MHNFDRMGLVLVCLAGACGGADGALDAEEAAATAQGSDAATASASVLGFVDQALLQFDPTLDPAASPTVNAGRIRDYARQQLGTCGSVMSSGSSVTVSLGSTACALPDGTAATGTVTLTLAQTSGTTTVAIAFANVTIDSRSVSGMLTMATTDAVRFTLSGTVSSGGSSLTFAGTRVSGAPDTYTLDGNLTAVKDGVTSGVTLTGLSYHHGDCYPGGGAARVTQGRVTTTVTFDASTASSGVVRVSTGRVSTTQQLPAYGTCPGTRQSLPGRRDAGTFGRDV